jgi:hypothetical protein
MADESPFRQSPSLAFIRPDFSSDDAGLAVSSLLGNTRTYI